MKLRGKRRTLFFTWFAIFAIVLTIVTNALPPYRLDGVHVVVAVLTLIPVVMVFRECYLFFLEIDEMQRRIQTIALLVTLLAALAMVLGIGLLQFVAKVPTFNIFWLWIPISLCYATAVFAAERQYI
ncbi:MAG TPA: hypothetical protein VGF98_03955 [Candidatus Tumulicola sp.]|jgi:hypothetical protein